MPVSVSKGMLHSTHWIRIANSSSSYVLFSIGNLTPLFQKAFPSCWNTYKICNKNWIDAVTYLEVIGIIVGQILVGILGDW